MTVAESPVRDWVYELNAGSVSVPDWVDISDHVQDRKPKYSTNTTDTTTAVDAGEKTHLPMSKERGLTLTCLFQEDADTGDTDAGQDAIRNWAAAIGPSGLWQFRMTTPGGATFTVMASANLTLGGGKDEDTAEFELEVTFSGAVAESARPALPAAPTSPAGTNATTSSVISWTNGTGSPDYYEVVVVLAADSTVVVTHAGSTKPMLVSGLTTSTGYKAKVRARNAAGWGPYSALSSTFTPT